MCAIKNLKQLFQISCVLSLSFIALDLTILISRYESEIVKSLY